MAQRIRNPFPVPMVPLRLRRNRRILAVLSVACLFLSMRLAILSNGSWAAVALTVSVTFGIVLQLATRNLSNSADSITDERERKVRDHAHRIAYGIIVISLGTLYGGLHGYLTPGALNGSVVLVKDFFSLEIQVLLLALQAAFLGLPTLLIAWHEPDPLEE